jgi:hypothetical protein
MKELNQWGFPEEINSTGSGPRTFEKERVIQEIKESLDRSKDLLQIFYDSYITNECAEPLEDLEEVLNRLKNVENTFFKSE